VGNSNVRGLSPRGLACMCASSVVELPFPKGANNFLIMFRKARSRFLRGCEVGISL